MPRIKLLRCCIEWILTKDALYLLSYISMPRIKLLRCCIEWILTKDALYLLSYISIYCAASSGNKYILTHFCGFCKRYF